MVRKTKKEVVTAFRTREILEAARRVMEHRGLEATMEEIAAAAGVAKGTLYLYFPGKDELVQALMSQVGQNLISETEAILDSSEPPPEKLRQVVAMLLRYLEREGFLFPVYAREVMVGERPARTDHWRAIRELEEKFITLLTRLFAEGAAQGYFISGDARLLAFMLQGLARAVGYYQMKGASREALQEALPLLVNVLHRGFIFPQRSFEEVASS
jgi:AcrR family transcriptional regulator